MNNQWIDVCAVGEIDEEDVIRFDHGPHTYAVYRSADNEFFATAGLCTHEKIHLADGLVIDHVINITAVSTIAMAKPWEHPCASISRPLPYGSKPGGFCLRSVTENQECMP
ncbi:Rieske 2Fe-2S protein [Pseudomonas ficuserectae]|nr:Rieske 2Fe-2S protein [Pseudomonas ficuserectae]